MTEEESKELEKYIVSRHLYGILAMVLAIAVFAILVIEKVCNG